MSVDIFGPDNLDSKLGRGPTTGTWRVKVREAAEDPTELWTGQHHGNKYPAPKVKSITVEKHCFVCL